MKRFRWACAWLGLAAVVACGGTAKVESGTAGSGSRADGGTGNVGSFTAGGGSGNTGNLGSTAGNAGSSNGIAGGAGSAGVGNPSVGGSVAVGGYGAGGEPAAACEVDLVVHLVGEPFACDCNTCWCEADGTIESGDNGCKVCVYLGEIHAPGETFPDRDGCNECECSSTGKVTCTDNACECQPETEWFYRRYSSNSAKVCGFVTFDCPTNTTPFNDTCGCGCEEATDCPHWIDCEPGNLACATMMKRCPYSPGAF